MRGREWPGGEITSAMLISKFWHDVWTEVSYGEIYRMLPGTVFLFVEQNMCKKERPDFIWKHFPCKVAQLRQTVLLGPDPKPAAVSDRLSIPCRDLAAVPSSVWEGCSPEPVPAVTCSGVHLLQQGLSLHRKIHLLVFAFLLWYKL